MAKLKTEHSGAKHGCGAFYGYKADAKKLSAKARRNNDKKAVREGRRDMEGR